MRPGSGSSASPVFQSSAHPKAGRNRLPTDLALRTLVFQSSAHPKAGRNLILSNVTLLLLLFQSSAHPKAGRNMPCGSGAISGVTFQSSAHPKAGRNGSRCAGPHRGGRFNPRPTRRQAATVAQDGAGVAAGVSILGPPEGRPQPRRWPRGRRCSGFNPRPTRRQAATAPHSRRSYIHDVSILGPPEGRPQPVAADAAAVAAGVSILGPPEGRPQHRARQPAQHASGCFNPRPTRRQAATTAAHRVSRRLHRFQSSAHPKAGRNILPPGLTRREKSFNPRPTRRQAATLRVAQHPPEAVVSILGPPEGRPQPLV